MQQRKNVPPAGQGGCASSSAQLAAYRTVEIHAGQYTLSPHKTPAADRATLSCSLDGRKEVRTNPIKVRTTRDNDDGTAEVNYLISSPRGAAKSG